MSRFTDTVREDTPRLVVMYNSPGAGQEQYQWGVVGAMPLLTLIGFIGRVQSDLRYALEDDDTECEQMALVIAWNAEKFQFRYFVHQDIPVDSLVGMLETIKAALVGSSMAQQARNQQISIVGPDGRPMRR